MVIIMMIRTKELRAMGYNPQIVTDDKNNVFLIIDEAYYSVRLINDADTMVDLDNPVSPSNIKEIDEEYRELTNTYYLGE